MTNPTTLDDLFAMEAAGGFLTPPVKEEEETTEEETTDETTEEETPELPPAEVDETSKAYFEYLKERSILRLPEDFVFDGSPAKVEEALDLTKNSLKEEASADLWNKLPEKFKPLLEYGLKGGESLEDFYSVFAVPDYESLNLDSVETQRSVIYDYYKKSSNFTDDKIHKIISRVEAAEELREAAEEAVEDLKEITVNNQKNFLKQQEEAKKQQELETKERTIALANAIQETTFIHPTRKNKVKTFFFEPIRVGENTTTSFNHTINNILSNPEHQAQLADILLDYDVKSGFDTKRLEKRVATKTAQGFQDFLNKKVDPKSKVGGAITSPDSKNTFDWDKFLKNQ